MDDDFRLRDAYAEHSDAINQKAVPGGEYEMLIKKADAAHTPAGKHCLRINFVVVSPDKKLNGRTVFVQWTWSPESDNAMSIFARNLEACGATQAWIHKENPNMAQIAGKIQGAKIRAVLSVRDWNGQERNEVAAKTLLAAGGAGLAAGAIMAGKADAEDLEWTAEAAAPPAAGNGAANGDAPTTPAEEEKVLVPSAQDDATDLDWP